MGEGSYDDSVGLGSYTGEKEIVLYYAFFYFEVDSKDDEKIFKKEV